MMDCTPLAAGRLGDSFDGFSLTATQKGAIGEAVVANALMMASNGRLSPFKPVADDDGLDLLVMDKLTRRCLTLQIKSRTAPDARRGATVQFDVREATFARAENALVLYVLLDGMGIRLSWLVPSTQLDAISRKSGDKLVIMPSASPESRDRYSGYRHTGMDSVVRHLTGLFDRMD